MRPRHPPFALLIAIALLLSAARAQAVENELSAAASVDSAYDSDVFNGRGPDFVNRISPHASWRLLSPRAKLEVAYDLGVWTYAGGKAATSVNQRATTALEGRPTRRLTLHIANELTRAEDPGYLYRAGVVAPQIGILDDVGEVTAGYALSRRLYGAVRYGLHHTTFDAYSAAQVQAGLPTLYDGDEHDAEANLVVRVTRSDDLRLDGRAQIFTAGPQSTSSARWALGASYSPTLGWRHQLLRELEIGADAGPVFYQALSGARFVLAAPGSGVTWRAGAALRWLTPTWRGSLAYTRDLLGATGAGSAIWADFAYAQVGYRHALSRMEGHAGGGYFRNGRAVDQPLAYDGFTVDLLFDYRLIDYLRLGAYYTLRWQETRSGALLPGAPAAQFPDVTRNIVGVRLLAVVGADARPQKREVHE